MVARKKGTLMFVCLGVMGCDESFSHQPNLNLVDISFSYHLLFRPQPHQRRLAGLGLETCQTHLEPLVCFFFYCFSFIFY